MISVCMATYNGERYLRGQVSSIIKQLGTDDEIVVSDDKSTDSTLEIVRSFNDSRIRIVEGPAMGHPRYNFENALNHCKGDYIFLCDQDDVWNDNKVKVFMEFLNTHDLVVSDCSVIDGTGHEIAPSFQAEKPSIQYGFWNNLVKNHYLGCCMAFRKELLGVILPFPSKISQHDIWIGLCAEAFDFKIRFIPDKLMGYRRYDNNFSQGSTDFSLYFKLSSRAYFCLMIMKRKIKILSKCKPEDF